MPAVMSLLPCVWHVWAARVLRHVCQLRAVRGPRTVRRAGPSGSLNCLRTGPRPPAHSEPSAAQGMAAGPGLEGQAGPRLPAVPLWGWAGPDGVSERLGWRQTPESTCSLHAAGAGELVLQAAGETSREAGPEGRRLSLPPPPPLCPGCGQFGVLGPWGCWVSSPGPLRVLDGGADLPGSCPRTRPQGRLGPARCLQASGSGLCPGTGAMPPGLSLLGRAAGGSPGWGVGGTHDVASIPATCLPSTGLRGSYQGTSVSYPGSTCLPTPQTTHEAPLPPKHFLPPCPTGVGQPSAPCLG